MPILKKKKKKKEIEELPAHRWYLKPHTPTERVQEGPELVGKQTPANKMEVERPGR